MVLRWVYIILHILLTVFLAKGQTIYPHRYFDHREYGSGRKVFCIDQSTDGTIFVGTSTALSRFDGERWETGKLPGEKTVFWMDVDPDSGNVFVGSTGEFGYFSQDMSYQSLSILVDSLASDYGTIWEVDVTSHGVYFRSTKYIFRYYQQQLTRINGVGPSKSPFDIIFNINDTIYTRIREVGLATIYDGRLALVEEDSPVLLKSNSFMPHPQGVLIATRRNGLFLLSGKEVTKLTTEADSYFAEHHIYHATALRNGDFAYATLTGGVIILTADGQIKHTVTKDNYGINQATGYVFEDDTNGLWIGLGLGVVRVEPSSSLIYYKFADLDDYSRFQVYNNRLYFGTVNGLYVFEEGAREAKRVMGFPKLVDRIYKEEGELFAADLTSTYVIDGLDATEVIGQSMDAIISVEGFDFNYLAGGQDGILAFKREGVVWNRSFYDTSAPNNIFDLYQDKEGIWGLSTSTGLFKYDPDSTIYYSLDGSLALRNYQEDLLVISRKGFFKFDVSENRFRPEHELNNRLPHDFAQVQDVYITGDSTWIIYYNQFNRLTGDVFWGDSLIRKLPVFDVFPEDLPEIQVVGDKLYINDNRQIFHYQVVWDERQINPKSAFIKCNELTRENQYTSAHRHTAIRFDFSTHSTHSLGDNYYRFRLEGYDEGWSPWSNQNYLEVANLREGEYRLQMEARTPERYIAKGELTFTILPPWYRTIWAYLAYAIASGLILWVVSKWRFRYLEAMRNRLEKIIRQRTSEINDQKLALEKSLDEKEALLSEIHHRVRNNLQVISGIFNMQLKEAESQEIAQQIFAGQSRIKAMALIHQKLHQGTDVMTVDFELYVKDLFRDISGFYNEIRNITCEATGNEIKLDMDTAIPMGLILNELLVNSLKHGFKNKDKGSIHICLAQPEQASFQLNYQDDGDGFPSGFDYKSEKTLGSKLIALLTRQLGGSLKILTGRGVSLKFEFHPLHLRR